VYGYWLELKHQKRKEQELLQAAYQSEINALKAQMHPHFLFNTLNSISASVEPDNEKTRMLIAKLADTFRYSLQVSEEELIPIEDELTFLASYLDLEQERFKSRLRVLFDVDDAVRGTLIAPMLLQPLVENAIKHGITPKAIGGEVNISIQRRQGRVLVRISDTGLGVGDKPTSALLEKGIGLRNTALRIKRLYNEELRIEKNIPGGLSITFLLPILTTDEKL
jgi:sensor histidine kinase YesM